MINKLFFRLQQLTIQGNMDFLIKGPSDLSYFNKYNSRELNIFLHASMVKPTKFFHFIKFPLSQNICQSLTIIPKVNEDLQAIRQEDNKKKKTRSIF
jgi:hypothetical protein